MELEAQSRAHIKTILDKVHAQCHLVRRYLAGEVEEGAEGHEMEIEEDEDRNARPADARRSHARLTNSQQRLKAQIEERMDTAMAASQAVTDEDYEDAVAAARNRRMLFAEGPPGTGKTFAVHEQIRHYVDRGARVLFVLPTGQLAAAMRAKHPDVDVDTFHGGLLFHKDLSEAMGILTQYDLVILDEISMLTATQFERVLEMWRAADLLPCV